MLNRFNLVSAALLLVAGVGGFTLWPKSGPATPLGAAVGSVHLSALDIHTTTPTGGLPVQAYDGY